MLEAGLFYGYQCTAQFFKRVGSRLEVFVDATCTGEFVESVLCVLNSRGTHSDMFLSELSSEQGSFPG